jgi:hypothetical protein
MISASEALSSIERAITGVRRDEDRLTAMLSSATAEADRLRGAQAECYKALARVKLDALSREAVVGELDAAERRAIQVLERRRGGLDELARKRKAAADLVDERASDRADRARDRDRAVAAVEDLAEEVQGAIARDADWTAQAAAVKAAEEMAGLADEKARQAEADRETKRVPYEADPLFMYLWSRGYGTSAYQAGGLSRWLDGKVAALIGFDAARPNYFMLNEIPLRLREHAERQRAAVADAEAALEAVERKALEAAGIEPLEAAAERAEAAFADADAALESARADLAALDAEAKSALDETADPAIRGAVEELAAAIARDDLRTLYQEAMRTADPEDEKIVQSLQGIERDLVRVTAEAEEIRKAAVDLASKRVELERSRETFRGRGYDQPWGEFVNEGLIAGVIEGIIRGAMSSRNLDDVFGDGYRERKPRGRGSFGGGLRLPNFPSGGGRSGGGGFRTGGGSGGGGFRTGGGF